MISSGDKNFSVENIFKLLYKLEASGKNEASRVTLETEKILA